MKIDMDFKLDGVDILLAQLKAIDKTGKERVRVEVGIPADAKYEDGSSVATNAIVQNFGGVTSDDQSKIPPRPFMTFSMLKMRRSPKLRNAIRKNGIVATLDSTTAKEIGEISKKIVQDTILNSELYAPNAKMTVDMKGHAIPLVQTRTLLNSIKYNIYGSPPDRHDLYSKTSTRPKRDPSKPVDPIRSAAAKKGWETRRANQRAADEEFMRRNHGKQVFNEYFS